MSHVFHCPFHSTSILECAPRCAGMLSRCTLKGFNGTRSTMRLGKTQFHLCGALMQQALLSQRFV